MNPERRWQHQSRPQQVFPAFSSQTPTITLLCLTTVLWMCTTSHSPLVQAKVIQGELITDKDWVFLTRFCFLSREGIFEYNVSYPSNYAPQNLLLYFDAKSQWPSVYKQNKTCKEKHSVLIDDFNQVINLTEYRKDYRATTASGCRLDPVPDQHNQTWFHCVHHRTFQSYRERWWFVAVDNCNTVQGMHLRYRITMTNSQTNQWLRHFSADEFYILHTDVIMCVLFYALLIASSFEAYTLYTRHLFHKTYKLYIASLVAECLGLLFLCIYYGLYAHYGHSSVWFRLIGKAFEAVSNLVFLLLLLLLAKGYTITRARLKPQTVTKFTGFMVVSTVLYVIIFYHEQYAFDPGEVLYLYESFFGYLLVGFRLLAWSWFTYAIVFTLMHYPQKSAFFAKLFLIYSIWFVSAAIVLLVATLVIPKWMREKVMNAVELVIAFKAHLIFFYLTRPSRANKNFPFHVRTTQIAIMEKAGNVDNGTLEHFTHYKYAPTRSTPLNVFSLTNGNLMAANGFHNVSGSTHAGLAFLQNSVSNGALSAAASATAAPPSLSRPQSRPQPTNYSTESEMTSMTSLSNNSARTTPPNHDTTRLPQAEE